MKALHVGRVSCRCAQWRCTADLNAAQRSGAQRQETLPTCNAFTHSQQHPSFYTWIAFVYFYCTNSRVHYSNANTHRHLDAWARWEGALPSGKDNTVSVRCFFQKNYLQNRNVMYTKRITTTKNTFLSWCVVSYLERNVCRCYCTVRLVR